jgi:ArsR family transcriptional regulator, cadmium/lead-responsive transcriptional repressor
VTDLVEAVGLAQWTVSKRLAWLRECGLVKSEPQDRASLFWLTQPALIDVLASAEVVLEATGQASHGAPTTAWTVAPRKCRDGY